ncbi:haloacid dehalogenase superfamily, subfamily IA, variant 1 with third motif having Dx(3-4)D or Dx(3-4)E [Caloramator quimbayensis]|uniref:Haloacid dehalogenase superfamily, subfamily IA, variant 1 with third motif having Dx(3-4)D or Dx(3-4)E n=1 Tax=Caloramator quimbayensis TaxID=1147123 RepID=A0A1T4X8W2_9CLOT|nr:HAD family hydrolase [Caloramator quimbayensis]SKA86043.1 haloacid dehalogenase superfamily, subfamily IA, variant 1 with third motif having Dx(3-4)D or Dx(3-4)E [Caloramator quimbayensis]
MINTILFDLDGTLLPYKWEDFEKEYFKKVVYKLKDILKPEETIKYLWESTMEMIINTDCQKTNKEVFMDKFTKLSQKDKDNLQNIFDDFYENEYKTLSAIFTPSEYVTDSIKILKEKGYTLVVATNPVFPESALLQRVNWAGLDDKDFILITSFERMHFCKPNIKYYEEILKIIDKNPHECMMIGNDVEEDIVAGKLGIKTFLVTDYMINKNNIKTDADYIGDYKDLNSFIRNLPIINNDNAAAK